MNRFFIFAEARDNSLIQQISHEERENTTTMCYICRLQPRPGALDFERCVEKNVPTGPLLGQLKAGMDITLPDGTVVKSSDVCLPDDPGPVMLGKIFYSRIVFYQPPNVKGSTKFHMSTF